MYSWRTVKKHTFSKESIHALGINSRMDKNKIVTALNQFNCSMRPLSSVFLEFRASRPRFDL